MSVTFVGILESIAIAKALAAKRTRTLTPHNKPTVCSLRIFDRRTGVYRTIPISELDRRGDRIDSTESVGKYEISTNRELVAIGLANVVGCAAWHARLGFPIHCRIYLARVIASDATAASSSAPFSSPTP